MKLIAIEQRIIDVRDQKVILDYDVAELYGVATKRINEAVKNNPDRFPAGYIIELTQDETERLRSKISTLNSKAGRGRHSKYNFKAFTEKGLYMLATILKSPVATETTLAIIETFTKVRELSRTIAHLPKTPDRNQQQTMTQRSGELISDLICGEYQTEGTETTFEINLSIVKVKHTIRRTEKTRKK